MDRRETNFISTGQLPAAYWLNWKTGMPACVSVTLVDGLVLSRSAFDHSMNYRSVVAFGNARSIEESAQKSEALRVISEHLIAGRWNDVRGPSQKELKVTKVLDFLSTRLLRRCAAARRSTMRATMG
jgi:nitroimidazol reductase NimA-like FMN-containing flavoprotein (pyridoxamine 5'-phosphate oxidase superfamily)